MPAGTEDLLPRPDLERFQRQRLRALLDALLPANRFYAAKIAQSKLPLDRLHEQVQGASRECGGVRACRDLRTDGPLPHFRGDPPRQAAATTLRRAYWAKSWSRRWARSSWW